jgi:protein-tyrosine phosphatase
MSSGAPIKVLFVCLGNICRSPTAEGIFQHLVDQAGLAAQIEIDSAGTGDWHIGRAPDQRAQTVALQRGYDIGDLRARQVHGGDFEQFHYILAMDSQNLADLNAMKPLGFSGHLGLMLDFADDQNSRDVPDPYYGGEEGFQQVVDLLNRAARGLLVHIQRQHLGG